MNQLPAKMPHFPCYRETVDRAVSSENLRAVASRNANPEVLFGLAVLAKAGDPVRQELSEMAVRSNNQYSPIVALLPLVLDRIDEETVARVVERDPTNALGHYLRGTLLHIANKDADAIQAFRAAASCAELRLYDSITGEAVFKAIDALELRGLDRLCVLSWVVSRWTNFGSLGIQHVKHDIAECARAGDASMRAELAELLLILGGHLFATNFDNRWYAQHAVQEALFLKADMAGGPNPRASATGSAVALQALMNAMSSHVPFGGGRNPLLIARFLPGRIATAFRASVPMSGVPGWPNVQPAESERAAFEAAKERLTQTARKLIEIAATDIDGLFRAYFKEIAKGSDVGPSIHWASWDTAVGDLMRKRPDLYQAAVENEAAMEAAWEAAGSDPGQRNASRMLEIAWALNNYATRHDEFFPSSLDELFAAGLLKPPLEAKSVLTGRPFIYVAGGEKRPATMNARADFVLFYDDAPTLYDSYACAFASCMAGAIRIEDLHEQLRKRSK